MSVRLLAPAQAELDEAISWYSAQAPGLGDSFLVEVLRSVQLIQRHPAGWHPLTPDIRRCRLRHFPYSVIYTVEAGEVAEFVLPVYAVTDMKSATHET